MIRQIKTRFWSVGFYSHENNYGPQRSALSFYGHDLVFWNVRKCGLSSSESRFKYLRVSMLLIKGSGYTWGVCPWSHSGYFYFALDYYLFQTQSLVEI